MITRIEPQLHNQVISFVLNNMSEIPTKHEMINYVKSQVQIYFNELELGEIPDINLPEYPDNFNEVDLHSWINKWITNAGATNELVSYFHQLVDSLLTESGLKEFYSATRGLISRAENELSENELKALIASCNVGNNSLAFWLGEYQGMRTWTAGLIIESPNTEQLNSISWWKVGGCDLVGAGGGFLMGGPKGALVGGAVSSLISIINQW